MTENCSHQIHVIMAILLQHDSNHCSMTKGKLFPFFWGSIPCQQDVYLRFPVKTLNGEIQMFPS